MQQSNDSFWLWIVFAAYMDKREFQPTHPWKIAKQTTLRSVRWDLGANAEYNNAVASEELH